MSEIARFSSVITITAGSAAGTTTPRFAYGRYAGGGLVVANTNGATQVKWYASANPEDTPVQIYADGSAVTTAVTVGAHPVPDACYGFNFIAPVIVGATTMAATVTLKG